MNVRQYGLRAIFLVGTTLLWGACDKEEAIDHFERTENIFLDKLGGPISTVQWWRTAVTIKIPVITDEPMKIWAMSAKNDATLYDYKEVDYNSEVRLTVPQGKGETVWVVAISAHKSVVIPITLTGKLEEWVTLDGERPSTRTIVSQNKAAVPLYGRSVRGDAEYYQFTSDQMNDFYRVMEKMVVESADAKTVMGLNCNYELESNGPFSITWIAGNSMSSTPHVLGYYYHSPGTYADIKYVDISETEVFDIIDGLPKVQYQVDEVAASQYGIDANQWYDANFDMRDRWGMTPYVYARANDDTWNTMAVYERYGRHIKALRGVSFLIDVPKGMRLGFYDRAENLYAPMQYDKIKKMGLQPQGAREDFRGTSFSAEELNMDYANGKHRSFIEKYDHVMWMGMENDVTGGDLDCNDVIFGVTAELPIYIPTIVNPDVQAKADYNNVMPWTIAYEDLGRDADYDFNDAVIQLQPNYEKETCCVTVMAAGSAHKMYLHYDGPDGDVNLGEIHELLGNTSLNCVNTETSVASMPFVEIDCVPWPKEYTMANDAHRFYIEIQRGDCTDCTEMITLPTSSGRLPQAMLVAGRWNWPMEGVSIFTAYANYVHWAKDATLSEYWDWYEKPKQNSCVKF